MGRTWNSDIANSIPTPSVHLADDFLNHAEDDAAGDVFWDGVDPTLVRLLGAGSGDGWDLFLAFLEGFPNVVTS